MGGPTVHARGRGHAERLCARSHGAGRPLSRAQAPALIGAAALRHPASGPVFDARRAAELVWEAPAAAPQPPGLRTGGRSVPNAGEAASSNRGRAGAPERRVYGWTEQTGHPCSSSAWARVLGAKGRRATRAVVAFAALIPTFRG